MPRAAVFMLLCASGTLRVLPPSQESTTRKQQRQRSGFRNAGLGHRVLGSDHVGGDGEPVDAGTRCKGERKGIHQTAEIAVVRPACGGVGSAIAIGGGETPVLVKCRKYKL